MHPISTRLTTLLNIQSPIVSAPMYSAATPSMAMAVSGAGAFGFIPAGPDPSQKLRDQLRSVRAALHLPPDVPVPVGVGFLGFLLDKTEASNDPRLPAVLEELPVAIWFAFGDDLGRHIARVRAYDSNREHKTLVFVIVNSVEEALRATNDWKVDVLVVQGNEAGGHGGAYAPPLLTLLQAVIHQVPDGPAVVAAGGISTGSQIAKLLRMGADGIVLGSRLLCTPECMYSKEMKQEILSAGLNATTRSYAFDDVARTRFWPEGIDGRAIANDVLVDFDQGLDLETRLKRYDEAKEKGQLNRLVIWAGVGIDLVNDQKDAATVVKDIHEEIVEALRST